MSIGSKMSELDMLRLKLKAETKQKLCIERRLLKLRNLERSYCEDLHLTESEIDNLTGQLEDLKDKIHESSCEMSTIDMTKCAEKSKFDINICYLQEHRKKFQDQFDRESEYSEVRSKELQALEAAELELWRQQQKVQEERNGQCARDIAAVQQECDHIEQECAVLKKRNNAIMLKLRRKLVETEEARRSLMKKKDGPP